jgi:hypothetical protein
MGFTQIPQEPSVKPVVAEDVADLKKRVADLELRVKKLESNTSYLVQPMPIKPPSQSEFVPLSR